MIPTGWELVLVVAVIMLLFGYRKLPDAARSVGQSLRILRRDMQEMHEDPPP